MFTEPCRAACVTSLSMMVMMIFTALGPALCGPRIWGASAELADEESAAGCRSWGVCCRGGWGAGAEAEAAAVGAVVEPDLGDCRTLMAASAATLEELSR